MRETKSKVELIEGNLISCLRDRKREREREGERGTEKHFKEKYF